MDEFSNSLTSFILVLDTINRHIDEGYISSYDKFFIDCCFPTISFGEEFQKNLLMNGGKKNENIKKTN